MCVLTNLQHLKDRHFNINRYSGVRVLDDVIILPLWNLSGQFVGYQQYRPGADKQARNDPREGRYYTSIHGNKNEKPIGVWGLESYFYRNDVLFITEGAFDACRLHNFNIPAVALLNSSYEHYKNWLNTLNRRIIKVEDDHASELGPYTGLIIPPEYGDIGEMSDETILMNINQQLGDDYLIGSRVNTFHGHGRGTVTSVTCGRIDSNNKAMMFFKVTHDNRKVRWYSENELVFEV